MQNPDPMRWPPQLDTPNGRLPGAPGGFAITEAPSYPWEQAARVLRKNGRFALSVAGAVILAVIILAFVLKDVYKPTARLEIDPPDSGIKTLHEIDDPAPTTDSQDYLETQVQVLESDALAMTVIRSLDLEHSPEFVGGLRAAKTAASPDPRTTSTSRSATAGSFWDEQLALADRSPLESMALASFRNRLSVNPVRNSRLVEVTFTSHDSRVAQQVTNALVTEFINRNYKNRYTSTIAASEWLSTQLNDLRQKVDEANQAVADFQKKYGLVDADDPDVPQTQLMSELNHQLADAQARRMESEAFVHMVDLGQSNDVPALRDDRLYQSLMEQHSELLAQLAQARAVYGDENSNVKKLESASSEVGKELEVERTRLIDGLRVSLEALQARERMTLNARNSLRNQMGEASSHVVAYRVLKSEAAASADLYNTLQARLKEAGIYAGLGSSNIHVVDLAPQLAKASGPHREIIIAVGTMFGCLLALALAFVRESFVNTVRTPEDVREWIKVPSLAMIPPIEGKVPRAERLWSKSSAAYPFLMRPRTEGSEAMRELRTALSSSRLGTQVQVVLVSSPSDGEGKTTVATNLAVAFARWGKTCLVDGDLRRSVAASAFGLDPKAGLGQYLAGSASWEEVLMSVPSIQNLTILPGGPLMPDPGDLIASEKMRATIASLRNEFNHVVIDSPPIIRFADARILSLISDAVVLVGRYGLTTRRAISRSTELLDEIHAPLVGVVVNDIGTSSADYRYYNYGFSRQTNAYRDYYLEQESRNGPAGTPKSKSKGAHA